MKKTSIIDLIKEIQVLEIKPDQCLCVHLNSSLSADMMKDIQNMLTEYLGCKVIVLQPGIDLSVVDVKQ